MATIKNITIKKYSRKNNQGFVILFAVLVSSIILLISVGMYNVISKEVVLSSAARESQRAFYAADSALECALYADIKGIGSPNPRTPFTVNPIDREYTSFNCSGADVISFRLLAETPGSGGEPGYDFPYVFRHYNAFNPEGGCSYVLVEKNEKGTDTSIAETRITAIGFNVCLPDASGNRNIPDFDNPTLLERRISIEYARNLVQL